MKPVISDPDTKINMSLDEIIRLTRGEVNNKFRRSRTKKRKGRFIKDESDHSVPLLTSSEGVSVYVSKKSPLLNPDIRQSFLKAVTNRALNAELLKNSTRIIPAKYELIKTDKGVERILVPVKNYICKPLRKLHHQRNHFKCSKTLPDEMPPLLSTPITKPPSPPFKHKFESKMEVDDVNDVNDVNGDDDDVVVLGTKKKKPELIDVEMNLPVSVLEQKQSQSTAVNTLNDRFTRLTGSFQF